MLKEKIKKDFIQAMKNRETITKNLLSVVISEIQTIEKNQIIDNLSDEDVTKILKKTVKSLRETNSSFPSPDTAREIFIVESYLPKQMTEDEVRVAIGEIIEPIKETLTQKDMGKVMGQFNSKYPGLADGKLVSQIVKDALTEKV